MLTASSSQKALIFTVMTSWHGNIFRATKLYERNPLVDSTHKEPVTQSFGGFFDVCLNKWIKQTGESPVILYVMTLMCDVTVMHYWGYFSATMSHMIVQLTVN